MTTEILEMLNISVRIAVSDPNTGLSAAQIQSFDDAYRSRVFGNAIDVSFPIYPMIHPVTFKPST